MQITVKAPTLPESIPDATIVSWHKQPGDLVRRDEKLVDIETEKVMMEVPAPQNGILKEVIKQDGSTVTSEEPIAIIETSDGAITSLPATAKPNQGEGNATADAPAWNLPEEPALRSPRLSPAASHLVAEHELDPAVIGATGKDGRLTKQDVLAHLQSPEAQQTPTEPSIARPPSVASGGDAG